MCDVLCILGLDRQPRRVKHVFDDKVVCRLKTGNTTGCIIPYAVMSLYTMLHVPHGLTLLPK